MYHIKLNSCSEIITDNINLDTKNIYKLIDKASKIDFLNNNGFIIVYKGDSYFIHLTKQEIGLYKNKDYNYLPYAYQRLIYKYNTDKEMLKIQLKKQKYLKKMNDSKPIFISNIYNILKQSFINFYKSDDMVAYSFVEIFLLLILIKSFLNTTSFDLDALLSIFKSYISCFIITFIIFYSKNVVMKFIKNAKDKKNTIDIVKEECDNDTTKEIKKDENFVSNLIVNKMYYLSSKIQFMEGFRRKTFVEELNKIVSKYNKRVIIKDKNKLDQEIDFQLNVLYCKIELLEKNNDDNLIELPDISKTLKKVDKK